MHYRCAHGAAYVIGSLTGVASFCVAAFAAVLDAIDGLRVCSNPAASLSARKRKAGVGWCLGRSRRRSRATLTQPNVARPSIWPLAAVLDAIDGLRISSHPAANLPARKSKAALGWCLDRSRRRSRAALTQPNVARPSIWPFPLEWIEIPRD